MKGFQWKKINNSKIPSTFWFNLNEVEIDQKELEKLFCAPVTVASVVGSAPGIFQVEI
jgi:hypothetical protein